MNVEMPQHVYGTRIFMIFMMKEECENVMNVMNVEMPRRGDGTRIFMIFMMKEECGNVTNVMNVEMPRRGDGTNIHPQNNNQRSAIKQISDEQISYQRLQGAGSLPMEVYNCRKQFHSVLPPRMVSDFSA